ncbi:type II secretion system protein GspM [Derxia lacustris]|uniref:type II secretion system protein GspM n=1 Tax=Derxia lacustris TaxID=764842 RepID=UPI000A1707CE|nr:type II secretion system protein GspM [Derxia lacustris]
MSARLKIAALDAARANFDARWAALAPRERRIVALGAVAVALALFWSLLVDPALAGRARALRDLPRLQAEASEVAGIAANPPQTVRNLQAEGPLRPAVEQAVQESGLRAEITQNAAGVLVVKFTETPYPAIADWLARIASDNGATIESAAVSAVEGKAGAGGKVNAEFTLRR